MSAWKRAARTFCQTFFGTLAAIQVTIDAAFGRQVLLALVSSAVAAGAAFGMNLGE